MTTAGLGALTAPWFGVGGADLCEEGRKEGMSEPIEVRLRDAELRRQAADTERSKAANNLRDLILEAKEAGMKPAEIAAAMGPDVNRQTVYRIIDRR